MSVADTAKSYIGKVGYLWGGNDITANEGGFTDCSGFTQEVFKENGVTIGRTTKVQVKQGTEVSLNNLQKGDLIFFKNTYSGANGVSHVGIYNGNGEFIHNSGDYTGKKDGVKISTLNTYWKNHFATARRVTTNETLPSQTSGTSMPNLTTKSNKGGTLNPTITSETASNIEAPISSGGIIKLVSIIVLMLLAVLFFILAFDIKPEIGGIKL